MERIKTASEVMIPLEQYPHISDTATLADAIEEMEKHELVVDGRKSLPRIVLVFDAAKILVGTVRRRDILRGLEPKFLVSRPLEYRKKLFDVKVDPNLSEITFDKMLSGMLDQARRPVTEVMQPIRKYVFHDDHLVKIIYEMVDNNTSLVPVVKEKEVVGVVRSVDVLHEVAKIIFENRP